MSEAVIVRPKMIDLDSHNTAGAKLGKWVYEETRKGGTVSIERVAQFVRSQRDGARVTEEQAKSMISAARAYCEGHMNCTIWTTKASKSQSTRYHVATDRETAIVFGKCINKTLAWAERTQRVQAIVKRDQIPYALREVTKRAERTIDGAARIRPQFTEKLIEFFDKEREEKEGEK